MDSASCGVYACLNGSSRGHEYSGRERFDLALSRQALELPLLSCILSRLHDFSQWTLRTPLDTLALHYVSWGVGGVPLLSWHLQWRFLVERVPSRSGRRLF